MCVCVEKESVCWDEFEQAGGGGGGRCQDAYGGLRVEGGRSWALVWRFSGRSGCLGL